ncbi:MAG: hypothetical protein RBQ94_02690 [Methanimicrococcus sp.]|nr:hypothetical protein [Methanimicrococcus sp.]
MKILAEIIAAESLSQKELHSQIKYLIDEGADLIDLGFSPDADETLVSSTIAFAKSVCPVPISIDSGDFSQIRAGILAGVDLVLSLDGALLDQMAHSFSYPDSVLKSVSFVILPDSSPNENNLESLSKNILKAKQLGLTKIMADPILSPPGRNLFLSMKNYYDFHQSHPEIPILFGAGNVTELFDADSVGMNALLTELADEFGASLLFTPNASDKGKGSVYELKTASEMMLLSKNRASSPKDLGIDLLLFKEKRKRSDFNLDLIFKSEAFSDLHLRDENKTSKPKTLKPVHFQISSENQDFASKNLAPLPQIILSGSLHPDFSSDTKWGWKSDPSGNFLIGLVPVSDLIEFLSSSFSSEVDSGFNSEFNSGFNFCFGFDSVSDFNSSLLKLNEIKTPGKRVIVAAHQKAVVIGIDSAFMFESVLNLNLISELSHAGYLGRELQKAEIALYFGRSFSQDDDF